MQTLIEGSGSAEKLRASVWSPLSDFPAADTNSDSLSLGQSDVLASFIHSLGLSIKTGLKRVRWVYNCKMIVPTSSTQSNRIEEIPSSDRNLMKISSRN